ncbi:hypothetical protein OV079_06435 [Nannocystis pusilla]|uniref:Uncharacterized protein n=1 Tax=Nannocystis pusilla TaxID=889268 RepID=A0A9X3EL66_9BACT|nr:hypothetical protein [Nannocystis pusilla]MCY1005214.1 hypothetical protein [Nannocystis pusilla]
MLVSLSVPVAVPVLVVGSVVGAVSVSFPIPSSPQPAISSAPTSAVLPSTFARPNFFMAILSRTARSGVNACIRAELLRGRRARLQRCLHRSAGTHASV